MSEMGFGRNVEAVFGTWEDKFRPLAGRKLASVDLNKAKDEVTFTFQDGVTVVYGVEGDCCSHSWVEYVVVFGDVVGAEIVEVSESSMDVSDDDSKNPITDASHGGREHECLQVYSTVFKTDRACAITLEYRNSSNGYYGGNLTEPTVTNAKESP